MSAIFDLNLQVQPEHIDILGHVNNVVYIQWMQDVALAHIEQIGLGLTQYLELKHAMVAVEHHVQYRKAAIEGDELILRTWLDHIDALYSYRKYAFYHPKDQSVLFVVQHQGHQNRTLKIGFGCSFYVFMDLTSRVEFTS